MSSLDLFEDGYPHGTVQGYQDGCRGSACPGAVEYGMSCRRANELRAGDYRYNRLVKEGKTPTQIAAIIDNTGPDAQQPTPTPKPAKRSPKSTAPTEEAPQPIVQQAATTEEPAAKAGRGNPVPDAVKDRIRELNGQGLSDSKIAVEVGVAQTTVSRIRRDMGIPAIRKFGGRVKAVSNPPAEPAPAPVDDEGYEFTDMLDQARERATSKRCPDKARYETAEAAQVALERVREKRLAADPTDEHVESRTYQCPHCEGWHLTSQPLRHKPKGIHNTLTDEQRAQLQTVNTDAGTSPETDITVDITVDTTRFDTAIELASTQIELTQTQGQLRRPRALCVMLEQELAHTETERDTLTNALQVALAAWGRVRDENTELQAKNASLTQQADRLGSAVDALLEQVGAKDARFDALFETHHEALARLRVLEARVTAPWWRRMVGR